MEGTPMPVNLVATQIYEQINGSRLKVMTGAHSFVGDKNCLIFKVPSRSTRQHISGVRITLTPADTYSVEFFAMKGSFAKSNLRCEKVASYSDVYNTELVAVFEDATGLRTSL
jgi:hypothetical protein